MLGALLAFFVSILLFDFYFILMTLVEYFPLASEIIPLGKLI
jgi:hypothetical protein